MAIKDIKQTGVTEFTTTNPDLITWSIDEDGDLKINQIGFYSYYVDHKDLEEFVKLIASLCDR